MEFTFFFLYFFSLFSFSLIIFFQTKHVIKVRRRLHLKILKYPLFKLWKSPLCIETNRIRVSFSFNSSQFISLFKLWSQVKIEIWNLCTGGTVRAGVKYYHPLTNKIKILLWNDLLKTGGTKSFEARKSILLTKGLEIDMAQIWLTLCMSIELVYDCYWYGPGPGWQGL